jgi:hypothetical protein
MPGWLDPEFLREGSFELPPPPHVVDHRRFPAPSTQALTGILASKELAFLASLALRRGSPEGRVLAILLLRVWEDRCGQATRPEAGRTP